MHASRIGGTSRRALGPSRSFLRPARISSLCPPILDSNSLRQKVCRRQQPGYGSSLTDGVRSVKGKSLSTDVGQLQPQKPQKSSASLNVGDLVEGVVTRVESYGAFVDLGDGITGLLHISHISHEKVEDARKALSIGDRLKVVVLKIDAEKGRINVTTKELEPAPGDMLRDRQLVYDNAEKAAAEFNVMPYQVGDVLDGVVQSMRRYGAFINVGGSTVPILHVSQISHDPVDDASKVLHKGEKLKVLVISMDKKNGRFAVSTKVLEPTAGDMLRDRQLVFDRAAEMAERFKTSLSAGSPQAS